MPNNFTVKQEIMKINYDNLYIGYFGITKTIELIC